MYIPSDLTTVLLALSVTPVAAAPPNLQIRQNNLEQASQSSWLSARNSIRHSFSSWFRCSAAPTTKYAPHAHSLRPNSNFFVQYADQLVLRFNISSVHEAESLAEACNVLFLDIWSQSYDWVDIRLSQDVIPSLLGLLPDSLQHAHTPLLSSRDLTRAVADTFPTPTSGASRKQRTKPASFNRQHADDPSLFFDDYRSLDDIDRWMDLISSTYSSFVSKIIVGSSFEDGDIYGLRVAARASSFRASPSSKRQTVLITGGQHAREWVSTTTVNYIAKSFITTYGSDPLVTTLLEALDFIFVPTLNPDGYKYTWSYDRLWRKNRQSTALPFCQGIDLDRSWSFMWDGDRTIDNPCSESYAGESAFEPPETRTFADWAKNQTENNNVEFVGLIDLHSYSQQILYPYSFSCSVDPPTLEDLQELGHGLAKSIRIASRETYSVLSACEGNVAASGQVYPRLEGGGGSLLDWFYSEMNIRKAYQIKLRDKGSYGFLLPREEIIPTGDEIYYLVRHFAALLAIPGDAQVATAPNGQTQEILSAVDVAPP